MYLVKIDNIYINADRVDGLARTDMFGNFTEGTNIFIGGSQHFIVRKNIDEVAAIIDGIRSEENK